MVLRAYLIFEHVINDPIDYTEFYEIELGHGRRQTLKLYTLGPAKRIKEFL
jgi:hypothetical protein